MDGVDDDDVDDVVDDVDVDDDDSQERWSLLALLHGLFTLLLRAMLAQSVSRSCLIMSSLGPSGRQRMQSGAKEAMRVRTLHVASVVQFCKPLEGDIFD